MIGCVGVGNSGRGFFKEYIVLSTGHFVWCQWVERLSFCTFFKWLKMWDIFFLGHNVQCIVRYNSNLALYWATYRGNVLK